MMRLLWVQGATDLGRPVTNTMRIPARFAQDNVAMAVIGVGSR